MKNKKLLALKWVTIYKKVITPLFFPKPLLIWVSMIGLVSGAYFNVTQNQLQYR